MLSKLFWVMLATTIVVSIVHLLGYPLLPVIITLFIIKFAIIGINRRMDKHKIKELIRSRIGNIEKTLHYMVYFSERQKAIVILEFLKRFKKERLLL